MKKVKILTAQEAMNKLLNMEDTSKIYAGVMDVEDRFDTDRNMYRNRTSFIHISNLKFGDLIDPNLIILEIERNAYEEKVELVKDILGFNEEEGD